MIEQCSGERVIDEKTYEWCDRKAMCQHYINPDETRLTPAMRMPAEKPCPHFVEWRTA